jgi:hypothetical protein
VLRVRAHAVALVVALVAAACGTPGAKAPPPPEEPVGEVEVTVDPLTVYPMEPSERATEPGFTYCCGNGRFKIEIDCREMLKRCYQRTGAGWKATYGRHCKRALGEACYLESCTARCTR